MSPAGEPSLPDEVNYSSTASGVCQADQGEAERGPQNEADAEAQDHSTPPRSSSITSSFVPVLGKVCTFGGVVALSHSTSVSTL